MRKDRFIQACSAAVLGTAMLGTVLAGTSLGGTARAVAAAADRSPATGAVRGVANLVIYSINSDGPYFRAIVSGAIGDYGPVVTVLPDGKVDPEHTSDMELKLRHGTFRLYIGPIASKFRALTSHEPAFPLTCSDYFHVTATVPIVAGSGTGGYRGVSGNFSLSLVGDEDQVTPPCKSEIASQILLLTGSGTVSS
ncbi:MAG TPA: hypothetical protein VMS00_13715 [Acidimicrobiales bacterium]|nr:hypothetical protein [Acidimicrobiales bacterium]